MDITATELTARGFTRSEGHGAIEWIYQLDNVILYYDRTFWYLQIDTVFNPAITGDPVVTFTDLSIATKRLFPLI